MRAVDNHVAGQPLSAMPLGLEPRELATSDKARLDPRSDGCYGGLRDVRMREQRRLDLTELNAETADLHHVVAPADAR
jgi:hypothetical protein